MNAAIHTSLTAPSPRIALSRLSASSKDAYWNSQAAGDTRKFVIWHETVSLHILTYHTAAYTY